MKYGFCWMELRYCQFSALLPMKTNWNKVKMPISKDLIGFPWLPHLHMSAISKRMKLESWDWSHLEALCTTTKTSIIKSLTRKNCMQQQQHTIHLFLRGRDRFPDNGHAIFSFSRFQRNQGTSIFWEMKQVEQYLDNRCVLACTCTHYL